jgi:hypothetical protein
LERTITGITVENASRLEKEPEEEDVEDETTVLDELKGSGLNVHVPV